MNDLLPNATPRWQYMEQIIRDLLNTYGYREIRPPVIEKTELFNRSIGEITDIVEKEMYTFTDRNGQSISLRPECTASCARAAIQHRLAQSSVERLWAMGPMFRYERPQKGRYRQFHQLDVEIYGASDPSVDVELMLLSARLWRQLGLANMQLEINSLGTRTVQAAYRERLVTYFSSHYDALDDDSRRRLRTNPLRILDSKSPPMQELIKQAPQIVDDLDDGSRQHFKQLQQMLRAANRDYILNPRLVRGLDYYTRTVFEWTTPELGAQNAICGGGRYDGLFADIGGPPTPAIGFAIGLERLITLLESHDPEGCPTVPDCVLIAVGDEPACLAHQVAEQLRDALPAVTIVVDASPGSFKSKLRRADREGFRFALLLGETEAKSRQLKVKDLHHHTPQTHLSWSQLPEYLARALGAPPPPITTMEA